MLAALWAAITAIPELLILVKQILGYLDRAEKERMSAALIQTNKDIAAAKTEQEYEQAAKELNENFNQL